MRPVNPVVDLLRVGAASALVAVPFVPYVAVGEQPYAAIGLIERVNALLAMRLVEDGWMVPPTFALGTSVLVLVALALPRAHRTAGHAAVALLATVSAIMAYRFTGQSVILHPLMGPKLLAIGASLSFGAIAVESTISRTKRSPEPVNPSVGGQSHPPAQH